MNSIENIRKANININDRIANIIKVYRQMGKTAFDSDDKLDDNIREIITYEMRKIVAIYLAEFPKFECKTIENLAVAVEEREGKKNQPECRGGSDGIKLYPGIQPFIDGVLKKAGIEAKMVNDKVCATKVISFKDGKKGIVPEFENGEIKYAEGIEAPSYVSERMVDSPRDQLDYLAELLIKGKIDIDWILDVLPHEAMHIFVPGEGVLVEGTTERLARECADKYGLRLTPTSHQRETQIVSKIEKIIGREALANAMSLSNDEKNERAQDDKKEGIDEKRLKRMKSCIDLKMGEGSFERLQHGFEEGYAKYLNKDKKYDKSGKYDFGAYRSEYYSDEERILQEWIERNEKECFADDEWEHTAIDESKLSEVFLYIKEESRMLSELEKALGINNVESLSFQGGRKNGLEDCMQDDGVRMSTEQMATRTINDTVLGKDENNREEENNIGE